MGKAWRRTSGFEVFFHLLQQIISLISGVFYQLRSDKPDLRHGFLGFCNALVNGYI